MAMGTSLAFCRPSRRSLRSLLRTRPEKALRMRIMTRFALPVAALFIGCALPLGALAQAPVQDRFPGADDTKPSAPTAKPEAAKPAKPAKAAKPAAAEGAPAKPKPAPAAAAAPARAVACSGQFAKDSSHMKLAQAFGSQNISWD